MEIEDKINRCSNDHIYIQYSGLSCPLCLSKADVELLKEKIQKLNRIIERQNIKLKKNGVIR